MAMLSSVSRGWFQVWECRLDPGLKVRVKNDFVQWQTKGGGGELVTYGIRMKNAEVATQVGVVSFIKCVYAMSLIVFVCS